MKTADEVKALRQRLLQSLWSGPDDSEAGTWGILARIDTLDWLLTEQEVTEPPDEPAVDDAPDDLADIVLAPSCRGTRIFTLPEAMQPVVFRAKYTEPATGGT